MKYTIFEKFDKSLYLYHFYQLTDRVAVRLLIAAAAAGGTYVKSSLSLERKQFHVKFRLFYITDRTKMNV